MVLEVLMKQSILQMEKHEIFDLTEALYVFAVLNHGGMYSDLYKLQCEVGTYFNPSPLLSFEEVENNNYYSEIDEDNAQCIWNRVKYVLDNRWDEMD